MTTDPIADSLLDALRPPDWEYEIPPLDFDGTEDTAPPLEELLEGWEIADLDNATWAARHLARRRHRIAVIHAYAES